MKSIKIGPYRKDLKCAGISRLEEKEKLINCEGCQVLIEPECYKMLFVRREASPGYWKYSLIDCETGYQTMDFRNQEHLFSAIINNMSRICGFSISKENHDPAKEIVKKDLVKAGIKLPVNEWLEMEDKHEDRRN
jgi:hypothetical protein